MEELKNCPLCKTKMYVNFESIVHWDNPKCKLAHTWTPEEWSILTRAEKGGTEGEGPIPFIPRYHIFPNGGVRRQDSGEVILWEDFVGFVRRSVPRPVLPTEDETTREKIFKAIATELDRAYIKHGREKWVRHQFYGIIKEEFREMEDEIFKGGRVPFVKEDCEREIIHVAAMCFRYLETGDRNDAPAFLRKIMD
jgi:hypothetical protein